MGGGKGGSTSTTNNISKTEIPPEVLARYNAVNARAEAVAQQPYQRYSNDPNAFVAGLTPTQQAGIQNTNIMAGAAQPFYGAATQQLLQAQQGAQPYLGAATTGTLAGAAPITPGGLQIDQYLNPFTQSVVGATQAAMNQQQAQQLAQQQAEAIRAGAFGGERAGLQRAQLMGQQGLAQAQAIAPLYQQGYQQALQTGLNVAQSNRQALQQMSQQLANLGQQGYGMGASTSAALGQLGAGAQQAGLAGAQAQMQAGQAQQQTEQAGKQAMYNQFMQEQGYPFQVAQFLANIATGTGALSGNTTAGTGTTTTTGGGGFFSDERLKENIKKVGETNDGQPIYRYNYKGDPRTQIGLLAQDVEKDHPEAVGLAGGYKTVDYKKATEDAVHKADGGEMTGDAYAITPESKSQMLQKPAGLGALALPQMVTGRDIPVRSMTPASEIAGLLAPKATGFSPGTLEAARAQRATLGSALGGGDEDKLKMGAGRGYIQSEYDRLGRFLEPYGSQYSSAGGLVGPEGGAFARGGLAYGGVPDYAKGIYGVEITPMQQRGILQGTPMVMPQVQQKQADPIGDATKVAGLVSGGYKLYKDRPDFLRSEEDVAKRAQEEAYRDAYQKKFLKDYEEGKAHGGLIGNRDGFYGGGYLNPQGYVSGVLQDQSEAPPPRKLAHSAEDFKPPKPPEQKGGGLDDLMKLAGTGEKLYKGGQWAAGKLGLGAPETAMSATSTGVIPEAIDLTSGAGLAAGVPEAAAAVAPEAIGAGAAALAPEVLTAGLAEGAANALPFLFFLKDGGAVPHRKNYENRGLVVPEDTAEGGGDTTTTGGDGGVTTVRAAPLARQTRPVPKPEDAIAAVPAPREPKPGVASGSRPSIPDVGGLVPEGMKDTLSSENFWVPALAGIGAMLASPNKTLAGAIGSGLVGGTTAYTDLQKQSADQLMKRLQFNKDRFKGPVLINGEERYQDTARGDWVDEATMQSRLGAFAGERQLTPSPARSTPTTTALTTAKEEIEAPKPKLETAGKPPVTTPPATTQETGAPAAGAEAPKPPATTQAAASTTQAAGQKISDDPMAPPPSKLDLMNQARRNPALFADVPENRRPDYLEKEARRLQAEATDYQRQADKLAADAAKLAKNPAVQAQYTAEATRLTSLATARRTEADQKNQAANKMLEEAIGPALRTSDKLADAQAELKMAGPKASEALKAKVAELHETLKHENAKYSFSENYKRQQALKTEAATEAKEGQQILNLTKTVMETVFDESGKPKISGGPLGPQIAKYASLFAQAGLDPRKVMDIFGTDPTAAEALTKINTTMTAELSRLEMAGSPVRVTEWNAFLRANPGLDILPATLKFIVEKMIEPKAKSMVGSYNAVRKLDPGKDDIENTLFDYRQTNPWAGVGKLPEGGSAQPAAPSGQTVDRELTPEEKQRALEEFRKRRANQGNR